MKLFGWICIVIGAFSFLGAAIKGHNVTGPTFWLGLGIFLVHRAKQKEQEQKDKNDWANKKDDN